MALTKAQVKEILSSAGVDSDHMSDAVDKIIAGHTASIEALREERDTFKAEAEKAGNAAKELEELKKASGKEDSFKVKYEAIKEEFAEYKKGIEAEHTKQSKLDAYKALLKEVGISEKRINAVAKVADLESIKLDKEGAIEGVEDLKKALKEEWSDFIVTESEKGASTPTPPTKGGGSKMTREDILAIRDTAARQAAMLENKELFIK
jgi:hypothetical protein